MNKSYPLIYRPAWLCPGNPAWYVKPKASRPLSASKSKNCLSLYFITSKDKSIKYEGTLQEIALYLGISKKSLKNYMYLHPTNIKGGYVVEKSSRNERDRTHEGLEVISDKCYIDNKEENK